MQYAVFSPIAIGSVCVYVCLIGGSQENGSGKSDFITILYATKPPSNDILSDVVAHDLDLLFQGQRFEWRPSYWQMPIPVRRVRVLLYSE